MVGKYSATVIFVVATLSLLCSAQQPPCISPQPSPSPTPSGDASVDQQRQLDMSQRSNQLDCIQKTVPAENARQRELEARMQAAHDAELRKHAQELRDKSEALAQLAADVKEYVDQSGNTELSNEQITNLQQIIRISHSVGEMLAGHSLPNPQKPAEQHPAKTEDPRKAFVDQASLCATLADQLRQSLAAYLGQNNQNTVSAVELKDRSMSTAIGQMAQDLEATAVELRASATLRSFPLPANQTTASQGTAAQALQATKSEPSIVLRATTRMVLVDAVVTDSEGKPVTGLKAEDFTILENGKKQTVKAFGAHVAQSAAQKSSAPQHLPEGFFTNIPEFTAGDAPPAVILVDFLNTLPADQAYMRDQFVSFLKRTAQRRNICIYALGKRLRLLQDFTNDTQLLLQSLDKSSTGSFSVNEQDPDSRPGDMILQGLQGIPGTEALAAGIQQMQEEAGHFGFDYRFITTMEAFQRIAHNLAGYPGRKSLIWVSATFPIGIQQLKQRNYFEEFHKTASLLEDAQIAIYPVDPQGLVGNLLPDASAGPNGPVGPHGDSQMISQMTSGSVNLQSMHFTMNYVANWTGGRAFYGRNDVDEEISKAVDDGSTYYALGYYPTNKEWNGGFRKIEVKVERSGLHVRHRDGYFANDTTKRTEKQKQAARLEFLTALRFESPAATGLPFVAQVIPPNKDQQTVEVDFGVDPHAVIFESQSDNLQHAHLDFAIVAFNASGIKVKNQFDVVDTHLTPDRYATIMSTRLGFRQKINLAPGKYLLKIGVRDIDSDTMGTVTGKVEVLGPG